jgi:hypothetical protein
MAGMPTPTQKTRTVAYLRVSTEKQADHGISLEAQRAKVIAYAALYDLELIDVIVDAGLSASTLERDGLNRALAMLRAGKSDALLVVKLDRLTRSVRDLGILVERYFASGKWALLSVGEQLCSTSSRVWRNGNAKRPASAPQRRSNTRPLRASTSAAARRTATGSPTMACASTPSPPSSAWLPRCGLFTPKDAASGPSPGSSPRRRW